MNPSEIKILWNEAYNTVPRILGLMDRDKNSYTYGCSDRYYWHYKLHDWANARLQDGGWLLSLIYNVELKDNAFFKKKKLIDWALASVEWWGKIQQKNGSFNEVYPYENSFCSSAFSTWWVCETYKEIKSIEKDEKEYKFINKQQEENILHKIEKAGKWLLKKNNLDVGNQQAASIAALGSIYAITGDRQYLEGAKKKLYELIKVQDETGFYPEYGGYDMGYQSLTLSCLYSFKNFIEIKDDFFDESLYKGANFLSSKITSNNGSYNWEETSRKTQYLYPYSLIASKIEECKITFEKLIKGLNDHVILRPSWIDDRYCTAFAIDYLRTYLLINKKLS